jgi:hypothetical protein
MRFREMMTFSRHYTRTMSAEGQGRSSYCNPRSSGNYGSTFAKKSPAHSYAPPLLEISPQRIVDDDGPAIGEGLDRMADISWYDRD